ncbi:MAG: molybdopterin molybdotransferase MoeA, partial [Bacillota bacterium]
MLTDISYETAQNILLQHVVPPAAEEIPLIMAFGRVVSHDLRVPYPIPSCPQSAMDGFALHPADLSDAGLIRLRHLKFSDIAQYQLREGEAVAVNTGFPIPKNTGAVIPHEKVEIQGGYLLTRNSLKPGSNIKLVGEDFQAGELLAASGKRLTAGLISAAAACGLNSIFVYRKPKVGILNLSPYHSSGAVNQNGERLPDSNGPLLASLVTRDGGEVDWLVDRGEKNLQDENHLQDVDLLLTTGGTYAKGKSEAQSLLEELGATMLFWGTRTHPGGHNGAGVLGSGLAICLSGNPAACAVGYELLAAPVMRRLRGLNPDLSRLTATCVNDISITIS